MDFLYCIPSVFVIGDKYEILVIAKENGILSVKVGDVVYDEENSGVLSSEKPYAKICIPQKELDAARAYRVLYRRSKNRKAIFPELGEEEEQTFSFKPLEKTENINIYHIADVHYRFEMAEKTAGYFGDALDLLIVNGDIGEVETLENYYEAARFVGKVSKGGIPVIFTRGNHDTRGRLAERYTDFFPSDGKNTYFSFSLGVLAGVVLDLGEDKPDQHKEYGGVNRFAAFRRREDRFLENLSLGEGRILFAISHICPAQTIWERESIFNIEEELYAKWNVCLARLGIRFMITGHLHKAYILPKNSKESLLPHDFPVVVGSAFFKEDLWGTAITLTKERAHVRFTDSSQHVTESYCLTLADGDVTKE